VRIRFENIRYFGVSIKPTDFSEESTVSIFIIGTLYRVKVHVYVACEYNY
jgi:hypothetical protein